MIFKIFVKAKLQLKYFSCATTYSVARICEGADGSIKLRASHPYVLLRNGYSMHKFRFSTKRFVKESTLTYISNFILSFWLNKLYHRCFPPVLKILEQLISEHLQTDDSAVEE